MRARDIMTTRVITVRSDAAIAEAAKLLADRGFSALPVVNGVGEPVGIVTEADLINTRFSNQARTQVASAAPTTVAEVMSTPMVSVSQDAEVAVVVNEMLTNRRHCVPVMDGTTMVGVITRRDVVRVLARSDEDIATDVRKHLSYLGGSSRWMVRVVNGEAHLGDNFQDASDRLVAVALAEAVPGVVRAVAVSRRSELVGATNNAEPGQMERRPSIGQRL
ncbi:MAG: CBS domain-containing protein [Actinomycetota bacterium]|nr:CBS domain-containing protein [Actinomycetota bacterium]